jgi:predicted metallopeptidase
MSNETIPDWDEASQEVIHIAEDLISQYHPWLKPLNICFVFRKEAQKSKGKQVLGQVSKVPDKFHPFMEYDYMIWLAREEFEAMDLSDQTALIDHELCHIKLHDGAYTLVGHDFEEFYEIIQRYGLWDQRLQRIDRELTARQMSLGLKIESMLVGRVGTISKEQASRMEEVTA